jgi:hypothetical protein
MKKTHFIIQFLGGAGGEESLLLILA